MKAFILSLVLMVAITALAALVLSNIDMSAQQVYVAPQSDVRL